MYCSTFAAMETAVRSAHSQCHSSIINYYIVMGLDRAKAMNNLTDTKSVHLRVYNTLLNTMCDTCLPISWREKCYNYLEQMMPLLKTIYNAKDFKKQKQELTALHQYFLPQKKSTLQSCSAFNIRNSQL